MRRWISLFALLAFLCSVQGTYRPNGGQQQDEAAQTSASCFCYGHTHTCSPAPGFSIHNISSTFTYGPENWRAATATGVTPADVHFRWSPKHQDIEVISSSSLPVYLYAPGRYLGNQLLSYGQNLTFSLRLDRGVRYPSTSDVVLEGSGLRVAASLGELRSIVPCGQKITYTFRLDSHPSSKWKPQLSAFQFQTLLQHLTALKIRATFGESGRGYLDNVSLISAQRGVGVEAPWVHQCVCPRAYHGQFCELCSAGYKRGGPAKGAFRVCESCSCAGGSCDPESGDCYSADETPGHPSCLPGYYSDPHKPLSCVLCPCPSGTSCRLEPRAHRVQCDQCPAGAIGSRCQFCQDGYYGDPEGRTGQRRPCQPCRCDGVAGSCDPSTGHCVKCPSNTRGHQCEACVDGYYHSQTGEACKSCDCNVEGSQSNQCNAQGQCVCRSGFEGIRCEHSVCPSCFDPIKIKVERFAAKLRDFEKMLELGGGSVPDSSAQLEASLRAAEQLIAELQENSDRLAESEKKLQARLAAVSQDQLSEGEVLQDVKDRAEELEQRQQTQYNQRTADAQALITELKRKLEMAKLKLESAELPLRDQSLGTEDTLSTLVQTATKLADKHQDTAGAVERTAQQALRDSQESQALVRTLVNKENKVTELLGDLKSMYDKTSSQVKRMEGEASRLNSEAGDEINMADSLMTQIVSMEMDIPAPLKEQAQSLVGRLDGLTNEVKDKITAFQTLKKEVGGDINDTQILMTKGRDAQKDYDRLLTRVNAAKADTERALRDISGNMVNDVDDSLKTLRGFDKQMAQSRVLADAAITRLPGINGTIQRAVQSNGETLSILGAVSGDYENTLETITTLVSELEKTSASLPPHNDLLRDSSQLREQAEALRKQAEATNVELGAGLDEARTQGAEAEQASIGANAALSKAQHTGDAVRETLETVENLLKVIGQPGKIDEERLSELENMLVNARTRVNDNLKPRLLAMEEQEAAQRSRLASLDRDIDYILRDISNLEDIVHTVPNGCFNTPPQETP